MILFYIKFLFFTRAFPFFTPCYYITIGLDNGFMNVVMRFMFSSVYHYCSLKLWSTRLKQRINLTLSFRPVNSLLFFFFFRNVVCRVFKYSCLSLDSPCLCVCAHWDACLDCYLYDTLRHFLQSLPLVFLLFSFLSEMSNSSITWASFVSWYNHQWFLYLLFFLVFSAFGSFSLIPTRSHYRDIPTDSWGKYNSKGCCQ